MTVQGVEAGSRVVMARELVLEFACEAARACACAWTCECRVLTSKGDAQEDLLKGLSVFTGQDGPGKLSQERLESMT